jgi:hypothetical protein
MERIESPATGDQAIEREIIAKGLTAPRVTPADIAANVASEHYFTAADAMRFLWLTEDLSEPGHRDAVRRITESIPTRSYSGACIDIDANSNNTAQPALGLLTFCVLVLRNGFTVTGESACASPENFDAVIGRKIARENALNKVWPLMGYALKQSLYDHGYKDAKPPQE